MRYISDLNEILTTVSDEFGIPTKVITDPEMRTPAIAHARHIAIYLACKMTWMSKDDIAKCFGQRDHSSVFYGFNKISRRILEDSEIKRQVCVLTKRLEPK